MSMERISTATIVECVTKGSGRIRDSAKMEAKRREIAFEDILGEDWEDHKGEINNLSDLMYGPNILWNKVNPDDAMEMESIMELYRSDDETMVSEAKDQLVYKYGRYVYYMMHRYFEGFEKHYSPDLFSCGTIGLLDALKKYDGSYAFTTYSKKFIIHEMKAFTRFINGGTTPHFSKLENDVKSAKAQLEGEGKEVTPANVASITGMRESTAKRELDVLHRKNFVYLDEDEFVGESIRGCHPSLEENVENNLLRNSIRKDLKKLDYNTRFSILRHLCDGATYEEIGDEIGQKPEEVRTLCRKGIYFLSALQKMRGNERN